VFTGVDILAVTAEPAAESRGDIRVVAAVLAIKVFGEVTVRIDPARGFLTP
jgi:hypothetical protein